MAGYGLRTTTPTLRGSIAPYKRSACAGLPGRSLPGRGRYRSIFSTTTKQDRTWVWGWRCLQKNSTNYSKVLNFKCHLHSYIMFQLSKFFHVKHFTKNLSFGENVSRETKYIKTRIFKENVSRETFFLKSPYIFFKKSIQSYVNCFTWNNLHKLKIDKHRNPYRSIALSGILYFSSFEEWIFYHVFSGGLLNSTS